MSFLIFFLGLPPAGAVRCGHNLASLRSPAFTLMRVTPMASRCTPNPSTFQYVLKRQKIIRIVDTNIRHVSCKRKLEPVGVRLPGPKKLIRAPGLNIAKLMRYPRFLGLTMKITN